jgi:hypothetical protein
VGDPRARIRGGSAMSRFVEGSITQLEAVRKEHPDIQHVFVMIDAPSIREVISLSFKAKSWCMQNLDEDSWVSTRYSISLKNIEAAMMFRLMWT